MQIAQFQPDCQASIVVFPSNPGAAAQAAEYPSPPAMCTANGAHDITRAMTKDQVKQVLDRVLTWPPERQEDAAQMLLALEAREGEFYHPDDDEWAAIEEGLAQARRLSGMSP